MQLYAHVSASTSRGGRVPGARVTGCCEPPDKGAGNQLPLEEQHAFLNAGPLIPGFHSPDSVSHLS